MKPQTVSSSILLLASLLSIPVNGQELKPIPEIEVLKRLDGNENGFLESSEIPPEMRAFIKSLIKTCSAEQAVEKQTGRIDLPLLETLVQEQLEKPPEPIRKKAPKISSRKSLQYAAQLISLYDSDGDQHLGAGEFQKLSDKWVECDLNQDLRLDVVEVACGLKYALDFPKNEDGTFDERKADADRVALVEIYKKMKTELAKNAEKPNAKNEPDNSRQYAQALVATYDKDQNGSLDSRELGKIGQSWLTVDFDKDGKATVDEIQVRFQRYESQPKAQALSSDAGKSNADSKPIQAASSNRADPKTEKPDDFAHRDIDGDGQIEMHEFATEFNDSVVRDFYQRDASHDGVITLNEWNRFLAKRNSDAAKSKNEEDRK